MNLASDTCSQPHVIIKMAADKFTLHELDMEIIVGTYEQVLFGLKLVNEDEVPRLITSFTDKSHCSSIRTVSTSINNHLASGGADESIHIVNLKSRSEVGTLMKHTGTITHTEFYDDFMISTDETGQICLWKTDQYECLRTLKGHKGAVDYTSVHPSGKLLLSVGRDRTLRLWNMITAKRAYTTNLKYSADIVKWVPDGNKYLVVYGNTLDLYSADTAAVIHSVKLPGKGHAVAFAANKILAVGCEGGSIVFVSTETGAIVDEIKLECNRVKCVSSQKLDDDKYMVAAATNKGSIKLYLVTLTESHEIEHELIASTDIELRPTSMCLALISENGKLAKRKNRNKKKKTTGDVNELTEVKGQSNGKIKTVIKSESEETCQSEELQQTAGRKKRKTENSNSQLGNDQSLQIAKKRKKKQSSNSSRTSSAVTTSEGDMDMIKKCLQPDNSDDENSEVPQARKGINKKHKRPVDSVKILKKKLGKEKGIKLEKEAH